MSLRNLRRREVIQSLETRRLLAVAQPDIGYGALGSVTQAVTGAVAATLADGRAVYATLVKVNGITSVQIKRVTGGGNGDGSFGTAGTTTVSLGATVSQNLQKVLVDATGRILIASVVRKAGAANSEVDVVRLTSAGLIDSTFGTGGVGVFNFGRAPTTGVFVDVDSTGRLYLGASTRASNGSGTSDIRVARLGTNGKTDTTYGVSGVYTINPSASADDLLYDLRIDASGRALIGANAGVILNAPRVYRVTTTGTTDGTFSASVTGLEQFIVLPQADGKTLLIGQDSTAAALNRVVLMRLNTNGSVDGTYTAGGKKTLTTSQGIGVLQRVVRAADGTLFISGLQPANASNVTQPFITAITPALGIDFAFGTSGTVVPNPGLNAGAGDLALVGTNRLFSAFPVGASLPPSAVSLNKYITMLSAGTAVLFNGQVDVVGTTGNDTIVIGTTATAGQVTVKINAAAAVTFSASAVNVYAQAGADKVTSTSPAILRVLGGAGNDSITGGSGGDYLDGGADNDSLDGGLGNDTLVAGTGLNTLLGNEGNDRLLAKNSTKDILNGGNGTDTAQADSGLDVLTSVESVS
ncbi:MAG: hypothetical protein QM770_20525 [Tepidisphaeraceae bacterium]